MRKSNRVRKETCRQMKLRLRDLINKGTNVEVRDLGDAADPYRYDVYYDNECLTPQALTIREANKLLEALNILDARVIRTLKGAQMLATDALEAHWHAAEGQQRKISKMSEKIRTLNYLLRLAKNDSYRDRYITLEEDYADLTEKLRHSRMAGNVMREKLLKSDSFTFKLKNLIKEMGV